MSSTSAKKEHATQHNSNSKQMTFIVGGAFICGILGYHYYRSYKSSNNKHKLAIRHGTKHRIDEHMESETETVK